MEKFGEFMSILLPIHRSADTCGDSYNNLIIEGDSGSEGLFVLLGQLLGWALLSGVSDAINLSIDDDHISDANDVSGSQKGSEWKLVVSKGALQPAIAPAKDHTILFFLEIGSFYKWAETIDPVKFSDSTVVEDTYLTVYTPAIENAFGGPFLAVFPLSAYNIEQPDFKDSSYNLPSFEQISQHVHLVPSAPLRLVPRALSLSWGDCAQQAAAPFRIAAAVALAASMVDVLYGNSRAVIKGVRHFEAPLYSGDGNDISPIFLELLEKAVSWIYEERTDTRSRLLADRISLDAEKDKSLVINLVEHLESALSQAVDQYRFVVLDRKDEYVKERRDLLKDIRTHAEIYADKTRTLIASFSRDTLAAFIFASFSLNRIFDSQAQALSSAGTLFFKILAVYFGISILLQVGATLRDISSSNSELKKWSHVSHEYLTKSEINAHINSDLKGRRATFHAFLIIVSIIYVVLTLLSWNLESVLGAYNDIATNSRQEAL